MLSFSMIRLGPLPKDIQKRIPLLKSLIREPNITFVYLFGGLLRERPSPLSDVDIAVYVKDLRRLDYLELFREITNALGTDEVDLVILNDASLSLAGRILQNRKVLIDKKPFLRHKYESLTLRKYFDFVIKEKAIFKRRYGIG